jgi:hypothetical protein
MSRSMYVGCVSARTAQFSSALHRLLLPESVGPATPTRGPGPRASAACLRKLCSTWCVLTYDTLGVSSATYLRLCACV